MTNTTYHLAQMTDELRTENDYAERNAMIQSSAADQQRQRELQQPRSNDRR